MPAYPYFAGVTPATATTLPTVTINGVAAAHVPPNVWNQVMRQFEYVEVDVNHQNHNVTGINSLTATEINAPTVVMGSGLGNVKLKLLDGVDPYGFGVQSGQLRYSAGASGKHSFFTAGQERMTVSGTNLGLNKPTPLYQLHGYLGTLGTAAGSLLNHMAFGQHSANSDELILFSQRQSTSSGWGTAEWVFRRTVDSTSIAGIRFGEYSLKFETAGFERLVIEQYGAVRCRSVNPGANAGGQFVIEHHSTGGFIIDEFSNRLRLFYSTPNFNITTGDRIIIHCPQHDSNAAAVSAALVSGTVFVDSNGFFRRVQ